MDYKGALLQRLGTIPLGRSHIPHPELTWNTEKGTTTGIRHMDMGAYQEIH